MQIVCIKKPKHAWVGALSFVAAVQGEIKVGKIRTVAETTGLNEFRGQLIVGGSKSHGTSESAKFMEFVLFVGK